MLVLRKTYNKAKHSCRTRNTLLARVGGVMDKRSTEIKGLIVILAIFLMQGCSYVPNLVMLNTSKYEILVCNLNSENSECVSIGSMKSERVSFYSRNSSPYQYSILSEGVTRNYSFDLVSGTNYFSKVYCGKIYKSFCDIAVQYDSNGNILWSGSESKHPVKLIPEQPIGFPVKPNA